MTVSNRKKWVGIDRPLFLSRNLSPAGNSGTQVTHESTFGCLEWPQTECQSHSLVQLFMSFFSVWVLTVHSGRVTAECLRAHWEAVDRPSVPVLWCCHSVLRSSHNWTYSHQTAHVGTFEEQDVCGELELSCCGKLGTVVKNLGDWFQCGEASGNTLNHYKCVFTLLCCHRWVALSGMILPSLDMSQARYWWSYWEDVGMSWG